MEITFHPSKEQLEAGLDHIRQSPRDHGLIELILRRPKEGERELLEEAELCTERGVVGDNWQTRGSSKTPDGTSHPEMQLNLMNVRAAALIAQSPERRQLAGDQFYIDLDLSDENLPPGTRLAFGTAIIEVTAIPHLGCAKFMARFGNPALKFVNSPVGRELHLRGINAMVIQSGIVKKGDRAIKLA
jgi:hypothetical protein